jgi:hypothetical protein
MNGEPKSLGTSQCILRDSAGTTEGEEGRGGGEEKEER